MSGAVILNWVLGAIIFVLIVGGGIYAIVRHGKAAPNYREADRHYRAKADPSATPMRDHVPAGPAAAADGLTVARNPPGEPGPSAGDASAPRPGRLG